MFATNTLIMVPFIKGKQVAKVIEDNPAKPYVRVMKFRHKSFSWTKVIKVKREDIIGPVEPGLPSLVELNEMAKICQEKGTFWAKVRQKQLKR